MRGRITGGVLVFAMGVAAAIAPSFGAIETREILKTYFETGDVPTQDQFSNLIDSFIHQTDDGLTLYGIGATQRPGSSEFDAIRVGENTGINELLPYTTLNLGAVGMATNWVDESGFLPLTYQDSTGQPHYGYLHIIGGSIGRPQYFPIFVDTWSWETNPLTTITTNPEPASVALLTVCGIAAMCRRNRRRS